MTTETPAEPRPPTPIATYSHDCYKAARNHAVERGAQVAYGPDGWVVHTPTVLSPEEIRAQGTRLSQLGAEVAMTLTRLREYEAAPGAQVDVIASLRASLDRVAAERDALAATHREDLRDTMRAVRSAARRRMTDGALSRIHGHLDAVRSDVTTRTETVLLDLLDALADYAECEIDHLDRRTPRHADEFTDAGFDLRDRLLAALADITPVVHETRPLTVRGRDAVTYVGQSSTRQAPR